MPRRPADSIRLALLVAATAVLAWLVISHADPINGSRFHRWGWWNPPLDGWTIYPILLAAAVPFLLGQAIFVRRPRALRWAISLLMLSTLLLQAAAVMLQTDPEHPPGRLFDPGRIARIVAHPYTTSYFTDAMNLRAEGVSARTLLGEYAQRLPGFLLHSREKPPGPILYWHTMHRLFPTPNAAALAGGVLLGVLATAVVPAVWGLTRLLVGDGQAAFAAASYISMIPAVVLFFPTFDQCYPVLACGMIGFWVLAVRGGQRSWAVACGACLMVILLFSYTMLVLGAFMALYGIIACLWLGRGGIRRLVLVSSLVLGTVVVCHGLLWVATGYDPISTFAAAWRNQTEWLASFPIPRPHPQTVPSDLQDFLLGSGWISLLLIVYAIPASRRLPPEARLACILCLAQPLITAATGLIQCETARVWAFMQPLVIAVLGIELGRWNKIARLTSYACLWLLLAAMAQNMIFQW